MASSGSDPRREPTGASAAGGTGNERDVVYDRERPVERVHTDRYVSSDDGQSAEDRRKAAYGGLNVGASFFGWLVAIALTILLTGILSAIAAGISTGSSLDISQREVRGAAGDVGLVTGIVLLVVLMIGYYAGGYVAGRMSRFDGVKQGIGVWVIGLIVTIIVAIITAIAGSQYDVFRYIPSIPIPTDTLTTSGIIALVVVLLGTLLAAILGGKVGQRYHTKVDRIS